MFRRRRTDLWLTLALRHWYWIVIGCLTFALALSTLHGKALKAELGEKTAVIESMRSAAQAYKDQSAITAKEINDGIPKLLEQAKASAVANYKKRYLGNTACGIRANGLSVVPTGSGETISTEVADGVPESEFISACASDAAIIGQWQQWARLNQLPVE